MEGWDSRPSSPLLSIDLEAWDDFPYNSIKSSERFIYYPASNIAKHVILKGQKQEYAGARR
jgi:hypothetical protein